MEELKEKVFLIENKCTSCRKDNFCLCVKVNDSEYIKLCLTCILVYFNEYDPKDEKKGGKKED